MLILCYEGHEKRGNNILIGVNKLSELENDDTKYTRRVSESDIGMHNRSRSSDFRKLILETTK